MKARRNLIFRYSLLFFITCHTSPPAHGQVIENRFTYYGIKEGLEDAEINCIIQDTTGYLWLGTHNGLYRFDGHSFKVYRYNANDTNSILENRVWKFYLDSRKRLWILTFHWLYLYHPDGEWFEHFGINTLTTGSLDYICTEDDGGLIITGGRSLYKFDTAKKSFSSVHLNGIADNRHYCDYKKDEDGIVWISTDTGLIRYDPKIEKAQYLPSAFCGGIHFLPGKNLITSSYDLGIQLVNRKTFEVKRFFPDKSNIRTKLENEIRSFYKLDDTTFLLGTNNGVAVLDLRTEKCTFLKPDPFNPVFINNLKWRVFSLYRDKEGIIWLGGEYLAKYDFKDYNIRLIHPTLPNQKEEINPFGGCFTLFRSSNGMLMTGSYNDVGIIDSVKGLHLKSGYKYLDSKIVRNFNEDGSGNIWCTTSTLYNYLPYVCAFRIVNDHVVNFRQFAIPADRSIIDMHFTASGDLLLASREGLIKFDTLKKTFAFIANGSKPGTCLSYMAVTTIFTDHKGYTWVGTQRGLNKIEKDGVTIRQYRQYKGYGPVLSDWYINDIKEDARGIIWFCTNEQGIGYLDPANDSVKFLSVEQGLRTNGYSEMCMDSYDNLWALSKTGIVRINTINFQNQLYNENEGFPNPDYVTDLYYSDATKRLYALTDAAIFEINPVSKTYQPLIPKTVITRFYIFQKEHPISVDNQVKLAYNENFIDIQFAALLFHSNSQIKYAYKMDGVDKDWVYCNGKRNAAYTNLAPGHYIFYVKAQSPEGLWNNTPTILSIYIKPPFWQTWWFYVLEGILVLALAFWIVRIYTARKLALQKIEFEKLQAISSERTRIAADMHDELGAGLTSIKLLSEIANEKIGNDMTARSEIEKIERSAANLSQNLREIIWTMNTRFDKLEDFIVYIRTYAVEYFEDTDIHFEFNSPPVLPAIRMKGELRRNVFLCIKEALNNIVKHSQATRASLTFSVEGILLTVEIKDNGIGISNEQMNKFGNGLMTMNDRLNKFGSKLEITVNKGTQLKFRIRLN